MKKDEEIFESLIAGGIIGAALGVLVSKKKGEGATLGAMAGAAILGTFKANERAMQTKIPMFIEEDGNLYQIQSTGVKKFVKKINKPSIELQKSFKLN